MILWSFPQTSEVSALCWKTWIFCPQPCSSREITVGPRLFWPLCVWWSCSSCAIWQQYAWHRWLPFLCRDAAVKPPQKPQRRLLRWPWQRPWLWQWQRRPPWPLLPRAKQQHWSAGTECLNCPHPKRALIHAKGALNDMKYDTTQLVWQV